MSEKRGKKRSKAYYLKCAHGGKKSKHVNDLDAGMKGFLVTCNKYERETVREMYNILNEYADKLYGPEKKKKEDDDNEDESDDEDMEKAMKKETAEMKEAAKEVRRFQNTDTKTRNLIFIRTTLDNPCDLAHSIMTDMFDTHVQKARYTLRMLPIDATCKANLNQIEETARSIFKRDFGTEFGVGLKFTSICKIRNNNTLSRLAVLPCLGRIVQELNPLHKLCHDEPDVVIVVEVIRNICLLSVVKDYFKYKKYNLHEIVKSDENDTKDIAESKESTEKKNDNNQVEIETGADLPADMLKETKDSAPVGDAITEETHQNNEEKNDAGSVKENSVTYVLGELHQNTDNQEKVNDRDTDNTVKEDESISTQTETSADKIGNDDKAEETNK